MVLYMNIMELSAFADTDALEVEPRLLVLSSIRETVMVVLGRKRFKKRSRGRIRCLSAVRAKELKGKRRTSYV